MGATSTASKHLEVMGAHCEKSIVPCLLSRKMKQVRERERHCYVMPPTFFKKIILMLLLLLLLLLLLYYVLLNSS